MKGNPFKPKAAGYAPSADPVVHLQELMGKLSGSVENLFVGFNHLEQAVKAMDRAASRISFLAAMSFGPRSSIPYDIRDVARHAGRSVGGRAAHESAFSGATREGWNSGRVGTPRGGLGLYQAGNTGSARVQAHVGVFTPSTSKSQDLLKPGSVVTKTIPGGPMLGAAAIGGLAFGPGGTKPGFGVPPTGHSTVHAWSEGGGGWTGTGLTPGGINGPQGVPVPKLHWPNRAPIVAPPPLHWSQRREEERKGFTKDNLYPTFLGSSVIGGALMKSGSPVALDTVAKSFELLMAKLGGGTVGPASWLSRNLQGAAAAADRNPEMAVLVGKIALLTAGVTGAAIVFNILSSAAMRAAATLNMLAGSAGRSAAASTGSSVIGAVGGGLGGAAVGGAGGGAVAGRFARLAPRVSAASRVLGPLAIPLYAANVAGGSSVGDALNRMDVGFISPSDLGITPKPGDFYNKNVGPKTKNFLENAWLSAKHTMGLHRINPFDSTPKNEGFMTEPQSQVQPAFTTIDDVYKQATLSALQSPLDQDIKNTQYKNNSDFLSNANSFSDTIADGFDKSKAGQAIIDAPPGLSTKP